MSRITINLQAFSITKINFSLTAAGFSKASGVKEPGRNTATVTVDSRKGPSLDVLRHPSETFTIAHLADDTTHENLQGAHIGIG